MTITTTAYTATIATSTTSYAPRTAHTTSANIAISKRTIAIAESENDVGKIIRLTGTDSNNRDLRSQLKDGTGVDGLLIPIQR